jgi:hypothetical protein
MKSQTLPAAALLRSHSLHGRAALARLPQAFRPGTPHISEGLAS